MYIPALLANAFVCCRNGFPDVVKINEDVIDNLKRFGPDADIDLNNVTMRMVSTSW